MVLTKQAYSHIIGKMENRIMNQKIDFLNELPYFRYLSKNSLAKIIYSLQKQIVTKGTFLFKEGEGVSNLFVIVSGEFEVTKMVENNKETKKNLELCHKDPMKAKRIAFVMTSKSLKSMLKKKNLYILGRGQVVGDDDVVFKNPTHSTTVKCISNYGEVFEISREDFLKFKQIGQQQFWKSIEEHALDKKARVSELIENYAFQEKIMELPSKLLKEEKHRHCPNVHSPVYLSPPAHNYFNTVIQDRDYETQDSKMLADSPSRVVGQTIEKIKIVDNKNMRHIDLYEDTSSESSHKQKSRNSRSSKSDMSQLNVDILCLLQLLGKFIFKKLKIAILEEQSPEVRKQVPAQQQNTPSSFKLKESIFQNIKLLEHGRYGKSEVQLPQFKQQPILRPAFLPKAVFQLNKSRDELKTAANTHQPPIYPRIQRMQSGEIQKIIPQATLFRASPLRAQSSHNLSKQKRDEFSKTTTALSQSPLRSFLGSGNQSPTLEHQQLLQRLNLKDSRWTDRISVL